MSALKYQLKDLVSSLGSEANKNRDPEVKKRFYLIKAVVESKKDVKKTCESRGVSTDQFYMWAKRLIESKSLLSLQSLSKSAKTFWNKTPHRVEKRVIKARKLEPFKGPDRISFDLKKKFNMICPVSTVAAILKRAGLVTKAYRDRLTKKHMKRYRRPWPGYMQMDFKYTPYLLEGRQTYQLSAIDHHSSWRFIRSYQDRSLNTVISFLNELENAAPFLIIQIQTDNATEFTDKFSSYRRGDGPTYTHEVDVWCMHRGIEHKLIPIGEKELNGKVENTHKWDDREFFSQIRVRNFFELERATREYNLRWNNERPTKTLGWLTPSEVIWQAGVRAYAYLKWILPKAAWELPKRLTTISTETGKIVAPRNQIKSIRQSLATPKKPKHKNPVNRYLQYLAWEDKQKLKSWLAVPMILQNFSLKMER
jgi:transposase InsO family protein